MTMLKNFQEFKNTLEQSAPHKDWPEALKSLWFAAKGNWEASHDIAQDLHTSMGSWIHAYLHRKEGDDWNAGYWYRQAGKSFPTISFDEEHREMVEVVLIAMRY